MFCVDKISHFSNMFMLLPVWTESLTFFWLVFKAKYFSVNYLNTSK